MEQITKLDVFRYMAGELPRARRLEIEEAAETNPEVTGWLDQLTPRDGELEQELCIGDTVSTSLQRIWGGDVGADEKAIGKIIAGPHHEGKDLEYELWTVEWISPEGLKDGEPDILTTEQLEKV